MSGTLVEIPPRPGLTAYEEVAHLAPAAERLRTRAAEVAPRLAGRTVWMVNSAAQGGGVAEMLPTLVTLLNELGIATRWFVMASDEPAFFRLTKRIHNLIHGVGDPVLDDTADRDLYERVNALNAAALAPRLKDGDILVVHDPQPMAMAGMLRASRAVTAIWRCHIGLDESNDATRSAWSFLAPYAAHYDRAVFSAREYVPAMLRDRTRLIYPAIDPLSAKNQELHLHSVVGILANAALAVAPGPVVQPAFPHIAQRLQSDGSWSAAVLPADIGLLIRPVITQISRWDRLKGWLPLLAGFAALKERVYTDRNERPAVEHRRLRHVRLVLAGPDPASIQDDPEGLEVIEELRRAYVALDDEIKEDVAVLALPMEDLRHNALMVNALQRTATVLVQNSLREGFGLTVTEAMWKRIPVLSNSRAVGPRQQITHGRDGWLIEDPESPAQLADALDFLLNSREQRRMLAQTAQRRAHDRFLVLSQLRDWLDLLQELHPTAGLPAAG
ncbi:MAG TPA: glycosyltransferase [Longimicrobiales bacterium]|nr:glycosyltransferase [Longimicrobiales bacterium]